MLEWILASLVPIALVFGWWRGRQYSKQQASAPRLTADYYKGLNYLLNEKPDKALDVFLRLADIDSETVETHLTLGRLFRKKGEVDKSIRIHQNLIARPSLTPDERSLGTLELGRDYMAAGLFDRAEGLFAEVASGSAYRDKALRSLRDIYVLEQEWEKAIETAERLINAGDRQQPELIAHYLCEMATLACKQGQHAKALDLLKDAQSYDGYCLRANYMRAELEYEQKSYTEALAYYIRVIELDERFAVEVLPKIQGCMEQVKLKRFSRQLEQLLERLKKNGVYLPSLTRKIQEAEGVTEAKIYLEEILDKQPGVAPLMEWLDLHPLSVSAVEVKQQLGKLEAQETDYQCEHCGYSSRKIQWHCPSCGHWGAAFPAYK